MRIASFNVENLFARPKVFRGHFSEESRGILGAYEEVNALFKRQIYTAADQQRMCGGLHLR